MKKIFYEKIGRKIQELRKEKKMSQKELAQKIGKTSATYINLIESGKRKVSLFGLNKICKALSVSLNHFLDENYDQLNASELIEVALISMKHISSHERKVILDFIHFLEEKNKTGKK